MFLRTIGGWVAAVLSTVGIAACKSDRSNVPQVEADGGDFLSDAAPAGGVLSVRVVDGSLGVPGAPPALAQARLALDGPGGMRSETRSDANGIATFTGIYWDRGPVRVTAYASGYALSTSLPLIQRNDRFDIKLYRRTTAPRDASVTISGAILNANDTADRFTISSTSGGQFDARGNGYAIEVPAGRATSIIAIESASWSASPPSRGIGQYFVHWSRFDVPPLAVDTSLDVDLAKNAIKPATATSRIEITGGRDGRFGLDSHAYAQVTTRESNRRIYLGFTSFSDVVDDGTAFTHTCQYVLTPDSGDHLETQYSLQRVSSSKEYTEVLVEGAPADGAIILGFLEPSILLPGATLFDSFVLSHPDKGSTSNFMELHSALTGELLWELSVPNDATSVTFPFPPSDLAIKDVLPSGALTATLFSEHTDEQGQLDKVAGSDAVVVPNP